MDGALDTSDLSDAMQEASQQQTYAPSGNVNDYGALPSSSVSTLNPDDVETRKQIFNNATQRILAARSAMGPGQTHRPLHD